MKTMDEYMALAWVPVIETVTDEVGVQIRLRIPGLRDFAVYGNSIDEVGDRWREALRSHIKGYLAVGKVVPEPIETEALVSETPATRQRGIGNTVDRINLSDMIPV